MSCLRTTQIISNWIGDNSLIESGSMAQMFTNKVNRVFYTENDVRLKMYYEEFYQQKLTNQKQKKVIVETVPLPKEHVPYQPTLLPKAPTSLSQPPLVDKAKEKDIPHSATAPHVDMPDVFLLGP
jgi:hypothetical protein